MTNLKQRYDVGVIDEVQMLSDPERGWAWTRAILGLNSPEIHLSGEERSLKVVERLVEECGDQLEVKRYTRLGKLKVKKHAVGSLNNLKQGDCLICFNKKQIYKIKQQLEHKNIESAIIYGSLPPQTKIEQAKKFNETDNSCSILVTTDAIGMGLNLNIQRIIFTTLTKPTRDKNGRLQDLPLTPSHALQISGRAGRFGSKYEDGEVTTMHTKLQSDLHQLLRFKAPDIEVVGLNPTFEMVQDLSQLLKTRNLPTITKTFIESCKLDENLYFLCSLRDFLKISEVIEHINLKLRDMYFFCLSPISTKNDFVLKILIYFATKHALGSPVWGADLKSMFNWPPGGAVDNNGVKYLENLHSCLQLYMWLSFRFPQTFIDRNSVRKMKTKVDKLTLKSINSEHRKKESSYTNDNLCMDFTIGE